MYDSIEQIIAEKGIYTGLTRGTSMWPLIHQGRDNIIIVRPRGRLKKYDVPVYRTPGGKYIMHRIVRKAICGLPKQSPLPAIQPGVGGAVPGAPADHVCP